MKKPLAWLGMIIVGATLTLNYWRPKDVLLDATTIAPTEQVAAAPSSSNLPPSTTATLPPDSTLPVSSTTTTTEAPSPTTTTEAEPPADTLVVTGPTSPSRFGDFQVEITVTDGAIVDIVLVAEPADRRSRSINQQAVPVYRDRVLEAQSSNIDVISGATVTWIGYTDSLQGALDSIGFET